ncbi:MAG: M48 family metallopeptidase [bacterium]
MDNIINFDAQAAIDAYLGTISGEIRARSNAYDEGEALWGIAAAFFSFTITLGLYQIGFIRTLRDRVEQFLPRWLAIVPFIIIYSVVATLLYFPIDLWLGFFREHKFGLSTQSFPEWGGEYFLNFVISTLIFSVIISLFYYLIRLLRNSWWIWGGVMSVVLVAGLMMAGPIYIAPLFNDYTPMEEGSLKEEILGLATAAGVPADNVYVYDRSRQTNTISANVSGFAGTTRISLADTLLRDGTPEEVRAVMAHEIGHYTLNHTSEMLFWVGFLFIGAFGFVHLVFGFVTRSIGAGWGIHGIGDIAGAPLLFALVGLYQLAMTPVTSTMIRMNEAEADIFGLALAREPDGFAAVSMKLAMYRKLEPGKWERIIFHDHPTGRDRVEMSMKFKAAELALGAQDIDPSIAPLADEVRAYVDKREQVRGDFTE